jgi:enamine deaminase RidA (YjgF/YER057c/UK114 family)
VEDPGSRTIALLNPPGLAPPVGFAHVAIVQGFVWLGGQISSDASGKVLFAGDMAAQFRQAIQNVATALRAAGCRPEGAVKLTYFVTDLAAYRAALKPIGRAYREVFGRHYPASSLFEVKGLFEPEAMVEIECVAVRGDVRVERDR